MTTITVSGRTYRLSRDGYDHLRVNDCDVREWPEAVRVAAYKAERKGKI